MIRTGSVSGSNGVTVQLETSRLAPSISVESGDKSFDRFTLRMPLDVCLSMLMQIIIPLHIDYSPTNIGACG